MLYFCNYFTTLLHILFKILASISHNLLTIIKEIPINSNYMSYFPQPAVIVAFYRHFTSNFRLRNNIYELIFVLISVPRSVICWHQARDSCKCDGHFTVLLLKCRYERSRKSILQWQRLLDSYNFR